MSSSLVVRFRAAIGIAALSALLPTAPLAAQLFTFDQGIAGWSVYNIHYYGQPLDNPQVVNSPAFDNAFGLPAGSLRAVDLAGETWVGVTSAVQGNQAALYEHGAVAFDAYYRTRDEDDYAALAIYGAGLSLYRQHERPPLNTWVHWDFAFASDQWRVGSISGIPATPEQIRQVLGDLRGVFIHTEWRTGPDDTSIDNVAIGTCIAVTTPQPASICPGGAATFQVGTVSLGGAPAPTAYRWQIETVPDVWTDLASPLTFACGVRTGFVYASTPGSASTLIGARSCLGTFAYRVRCVVTGSCGTATSPPAELSICFADMSCDGIVAVQDLFDFLAFYFAGDSRADINDSGVLSLQDIFDYLAAYFAGC